MLWRVAVSTVLAILLLISCVYSNTRTYDTKSAESGDAAGDFVAADAGKIAVDADNSDANHKQLLADLKQAQKAVQKMPGYETRFVRQIRKGDELLEPEEMNLKLRHKPFSVYLHWPDDGKQALYVQGQNDNKLVVKLDKGLLGLAGPLQLEPDDEQAMQSSRYPVTEIGLLNLVNRVLEIHEHAQLEKVAYDCKTENLDGADCTCYTIRFQSPDVQPEYSKTVLHIATKSGLPMRVSSYGWDGGNPGELVEHYEYHDVQPNAQLRDWDFDPNNEKYSFRK